MSQTSRIDACILCYNCIFHENVQNLVFFKMPLAFYVHGLNEEMFIVLPKNRLPQYIIAMGYIKVIICSIKLKFSYQLQLNIYLMIPIRDRIDSYIYLQEFYYE